ncbi:FAD-dependent monooxygenase [Curtobacterium sp. Leaf261]|uniref:FAD-dependent monooxygenase n=1 Tax=Curtobacterium sp. Leaf261 TaxID=1736311 RepID=UPI0006FAE850|nr:FAD-dependent monooxygenase [Curtobacterium sp. Leaf261]KQO59770.1 FAD-binding monooxygenase [Curtobacterium sp. Leaf261]
MTTPGTPRRALISGASIAGPALAHWLRRDGWQVTIVERAPALRTGGQNVDVRGAGREVLRRMGLDEAVLAAGTGEVGTRFVTADGSAIAEFPAGTDDTGGATAEAEILRGDLAEIVIGSTEGVKYRFGDRITAIDDPTTKDPSGPGNGGPATVSFEHAADEEFELVVIAEGLRSTTRRMVFGAEVQLRPLGLQCTFLTIPRTEDDDRWWRWYNAPGGRSVTLRPDNHGTTRALLNSRIDRDAPDIGRLDRDELVAALRERFTGAGWQSERILAALDDADDVYSQTIAQVRAPRWSTGRVVLLGDAAYCASPVSGMGTTLSLVGAYMLGSALRRSDDGREALRTYEREFRGYTERAQDLPPGTPGAANPFSRAGITALNTVMRIAASPFGRALQRMFQRPPADDFTLPPMPERAEARPAA